MIMNNILSLGITNVYAENIAENFCQDLGSTLQLVSALLLVVRIAVPLLLIGMATMDLYKVVTNGKDSELSKQIKVLGTRAIIGIAVFFLPTIVRVVVNAVADDQSDYLVCVSCLDNPANCPSSNK